MNNASSTENVPEFVGRRAAVYLGSALLLALFLALVFTWRDNGRRAALETTAEFTAVGDSHYFPMPAAPPTRVMSSAWNSCFRKSAGYNGWP